MLLIIFFLFCVVSGFDVMNEHDFSGDGCKSGKLGRSSVKCISVSFSISSFDDLWLQRSMDKVEELLHVREVVFTLNASPEDLSGKAVGSIVDSFLKSHPWWVIVKDYLQHNSPSLSLLRFFAAWEPFLRVLTKIQFPPESTCDTTPMMIGHMINSGWGSAGYMYNYRRFEHIWAVFTVYYSDHHLTEEFTHFSDANTCPTVVNKFQCIFLELTNCSLPTFVTTCETCLLNQEFLYSSSSSSRGYQVIHQNHIESLGTAAINVYQEGLVMPNCPRLRHNRFINAVGKDSVFLMECHDVLFVHGVLYRLSYLYRTEVTTHILKMRATNQIPFAIGTDTTESCVAFHMRRGDRTLSGVDMKEYCYIQTKNHTITLDDCLNSLDTINCAGLEDYGCFSTHSFGEVTIDMLVRRAVDLVPDVKHYFIMTDDASGKIHSEIHSWKSEHTSEIPGLDGGKAQFSVLAAHPHARVSSLYPEENHLANGVNFWASIEIARQCTAFVGHFGSSISIMVYQAMCHHHRGVTGQCPLAADIGGTAGMQPQDDDYEDELD